jgi:para-nitrobenzyl esterase
MLIGTTRDECGFLHLSNPKLLSLDQTALRTELMTLGISSTNADSLIEAYQATRPGESPSDIFLAIASDRMFRMEAILQAQRKFAQGSAPAYMYFFAWEAPGNFKAGHGLEVPFVFGNLDKAPALWSTGSDPHFHELAESISAAWVAFARSGNPSHRGLPPWQPYNVTSRATMILNNSCELVNDPQRHDRLAMESFGG